MMATRSAFPFLTKVAPAAGSIRLTSSRLYPPTFMRAIFRRRVPVRKSWLVIFKEHAGVGVVEVQAGQLDLRPDPELVCDPARALSPVHASLKQLEAFAGLGGVLHALRRVYAFSPFIVVAHRVPVFRQRGDVVNVVAVSCVVVAGEGGAQAELLVFNRVRQAQGEHLAPRRQVCRLTYQLIDARPDRFVDLVICEGVRQCRVARTAFVVTRADVRIPTPVVGQTALGPAGGEGPRARRAQLNDGARCLGPVRDL